MRPATALLLCVAALLLCVAADAFTRPQGRRAPVVRRAAVDLSTLPSYALAESGALPSYALAESGAGANDPFLLTLAGLSIGLFVFVVGAAGYMTYQEQSSKKNMEAEDNGTKPKLLTMAELEAQGIADPDELVKAADMPTATNRNERRQNRKMVKKKIKPEQDRARF